MSFCLRLRDSIRNSRIPALHSFHRTIPSGIIQGNDIITLQCALNEDLWQDSLSSLHRETAFPKLIHFYLKDATAPETMTIFSFYFGLQETQNQICSPPQAAAQNNLGYIPVCCFIPNQLYLPFLDSLNRRVYPLHIFYNLPQGLNKTVNHPKFLVFPLGGTQTLYKLCGLYNVYNMQTLNKSVFVSIKLQFFKGTKLYLLQLYINYIQLYM